MAAAAGQVFERHAKLLSRGAPESVDYLNGRWQVRTRRAALARQSLEEGA